MIEGRLVPSTNAGRHAIGNAETGPDVSSGTVLDVQIAGRWIRGCVEHSMAHEGPGCYTISDTGRSRTGQCSLSEAEWQHAVRDSESGNDWDLSEREHTGQIYGCAVSADGQVVVAAFRNETLKVWDGVSGTELHTLWGHNDRVRGCAISADGQVIVSASEDHTLRVWDGINGAHRHTLVGHSSWVHGCAVSADGRIIVSASADGTLKVWDGRTGRCLLTFPVDGPLYGCALARDGEHLVACGAQGVFFLRLLR